MGADDVRFGIDRWDDVRAETGALGHFFASREAVADWLAANPEGMVHSVEEDFQLRPVGHGKAGLGGLEERSTMSRMEGVAKIQILQVPDCPNVDRVRETVRRVLAQVQIDAEVEEVVGEYPSPTLLVDGRDVTGRPLGATANCRLDLPTEQQLLTALGIGGTDPRLQAMPVDEEIRAAAFRRLFRNGAPAWVEDVAADVGRPLEEVQRTVVGLGHRGHLRLDQERRIVGSAGLSIGPDRHQIDIAGRRFWTWCAWDILGIFGALRATGTAHSPSPLSDEPLEVTFASGRPLPTDLVVFRPDEGWKDCCANIYEEWCPNSNFFEDRAAALNWAADHGLAGRVLALAEASELAAMDWEQVASGVRL